MKNYKPFFSILMPVYNREQYLKQAINSVLEQSFRNFELIIVDDCSTDNSIGIINEYINKDARIKTYFFKEKQNVSICRNKLLDLAVGKYVLFIDSDDYFISDQTLAFLKDKITNEKTLICFSTNDYNNDTKEVKRTSFISFTNELIAYKTQQAIFLDFVKGKFSVTLWNKAFSNDIIKEKKLLFPSNIEIGEDYVFLLQYCLFIENVQTFSNVFYERRVHQSLYETHKDFNYKFYNWFEQNMFFYRRSIELGLNNTIDMFIYLTFHRYVGTIKKHYFKTIKLFNNKIDIYLKKQMRCRYKRIGLSKREIAFAKSYFFLFYRFFVFPFTLAFYKLFGIH